MLETLNSATQIIDTIQSIPRFKDIYAERIKRARTLLVKKGVSADLHPDKLQGLLGGLMFSQKIGLWLVPPRKITEGQTLQDTLIPYIYCIAEFYLEAIEKQIGGQSSV